MTLPTGKPATIEAVTQEILDLLLAEVGGVGFTADTILEGQGLDSLKLMSLLFQDREPLRLRPGRGRRGRFEYRGRFSSLSRPPHSGATVRGASVIHPKHETLNEMLAAAAQSGVNLFFVNPKEEDEEVLMARVRRST